MSDQSPRLLDQVRGAVADRRPLKIVGGNSKASILGRAIEGEIIDVAGHRGIVTYLPTEMVITARAGTPLAEIEAALAGNGQALSFEPPHLGPGATIGGTLACNLSGPARPWGGSVRDMVLGIRLINGKAEHLRFGGQVMKNVAGFDLSRLQAGALGTLGIITEISLKVVPVPRAVTTLTAAMDQGDAIRRMAEVAARPTPLSGAAWADGKLYLRFPGAASAPSLRGRWGGDVMDAGAADAFWNDLREQRLPFFAGDGPLWRLSLTATAPAMSPDCLVDWGGAQRWLRHGDRESLAGDTAIHGGHAVLFRGGARGDEVRSPPPPAVMALQRRLKAAFDPAGIFNPGRLYGEL